MMWKSLQMPRSFQKVETGEDGRYAKFVVEALERGWGITLGNALRRSLLSSLQGAAIVSVKIEGVDKEFSTIPGVKEDVTDIILNLKSIRVKLLSDHDETLRLDMSGEGEVTAKDFMDNPNVAILTPDVHIATLNGNASLSLEVKISSGRGYVTADELKDKDAPIGVIAMDANFNPVQKVAMHISDTRVGQKTDYNRLELEITTDGSIDPEDALAYAAKLLMVIPSVSLLLQLSLLWGRANANITNVNAQSNMAKFKCLRYSFHDFGRLPNCSVVDICNEACAVFCFQI